jgi:hypothetical protein
LFIPKQAFLDCGYFKEELRTTQDYDLWFRMSKRYDFIHQSKCLVKFRIHPNQDSNKLSLIALEECNVFYERATLELSVEEVIRGSETDLKTGLEKMLTNFIHRGWKVASENLSEKLGIPIVTDVSSRASLKQLWRRAIGKLLNTFKI